jgi:exosome complex RNA-binding protein Rrp4
MCVDQKSVNRMSTFGDFLMAHVSDLDSNLKLLLIVKSPFYEKYVFGQMFHQNNRVPYTDKYCLT